MKIELFIFASIISVSVQAQTVQQMLKESADATKRFSEGYKKSNGHMGDKLIEGMIESTTPEADEATRNIQRGAIKFAIDPNDQRSQQHWQQVEKGARSITGSTEQRALANSSASHYKKWSSSVKENKPSNIAVDQAFYISIKHIYEQAKRDQAASPSVLDDLGRALKQYAPPIQKELIFFDDFEDGSLKKWSIGGRREGKHLSEIIFENNSRVAHIRHDDFSEIEMKKEFPFNQSYNFSFDMKVFSTSQASKTSNFYARGGVQIQFISSSGKTLGSITYLNTTSTYALKTSPTSAKFEIKSTKWNHYDISTKNLLSKIDIDLNQVKKIALVFSGYTSGWPYNMHGEVWVDNVSVCIR